LWKAGSRNPYITREALKKEIRQGKHKWLQNKKGRSVANMTAFARGNIIIEI
jgi:hypothetical protein